MYLKSERELYHHRRRIPLWRILVLVVLAIIGGYVGYTMLTRSENPIVVMPTATPLPTPTRAPVLHIAEAEDAYWQGHLSTAIEAYQRALDLEPHQTEVYVELARLLILRDHPERGLEMAREALRRQPENARAWAVLGLAYDWLGLPEEGIRACKKAVELDPALPEAYAYLAEAYADNGEWYNAGEAIETALKLDENNVDVLRNQGYLRETTQGNYIGAIEIYRKALEQHPGLAHLYISIGRNANAMQNWNLALEAYGDAVEADPGSAAASDRLGWTYLLTGEYEKAEESLLRALEIDPSYPDTYGHLATLYLQNRDYENARDVGGTGIRYSQADRRRRTVFFVITLEASGAQLIDGPTGTEVARAPLIHPVDFEMPLRGMLAGAEGYPTVQGRLRFNVMRGQYTLEMTGLPPAPSGKIYVGWFQPLFTPENTPVHTPAIFPAPDGRVSMDDETGAVKGPHIENYYILALAHYLLDECNQAVPYLNVALRINPQYEYALQTLELCRE